ncbi:protein phosphatase 1 regulatory subunit 32 isoform X2 [Sorex araneus]|uniref:protein phosphatase 1 regulatory subunit 32 isoform X2 n=1 Tax=Sorex araneus TaxID=42254 RepID=UPI002433AFC0|nr:protein phosphatase 1 regulatory subunit 32 isoform X2 [Sorex araneus]
MMGKLPLGVVSPYVKMSSGGCTDPLKFYATSYCTAYGREDFQPRMGSHRGTGYERNLRPLVTSLDSPASGEKQRDGGFQTLSSQHYRALEVPDGKAPLPRALHQTLSGFSREAVRSAAPLKEVRKVHFDTQDYGAQSITGLEPKEVPLLHQQQGKGSLEWENSRHGPRSMVTEYNSKYREPLSQPDLLQKKCIGPREESGFTEESTKNPIAFLPPSQALPGDPGNEFLPVLARGTDRESGFSRPSERNINPRVPAPPPEPCTMSLRQFQSPQRLQQTNLGLLGRQSTGNKEPSGYTLNNPSYVRSTQDPAVDNHYLTTYNQGYFDNTPKGLDREGWTRGGVQPQKPGGYALNQPVTRLEGVPNPEENLRRLHPHVGRTLIATDPFYRNPPHSNHFTAPN